MTIAWPENAHAEMAEMYREGKTCAQLADYFGVSRGTIRNQLITMGVRLRPVGKVRLGCAKLTPSHGKPDAGSAGAAIETAPSYREHSHRSLMEPIPTNRPDTIPDLELAFWPTARKSLAVAIEPPVVNCQRCGADILPTVGWWCSDCDEIIWWLQQERGMSMVQIAHSGEYDPPWEEWIQDVAPWLISGRIDRLQADKLALKHEASAKLKPDRVTLEHRTRSWCSVKQHNTRLRERFLQNYLNNPRLKGGAA